MWLMNKIVTFAESSFKRKKNCSTPKKHSTINLVAAFHFSYLIKNERFRCEYPRGRPGLRGRDGLRGEPGKKWFSSYFCQIFELIIFERIIVNFMSARNSRKTCSITLRPAYRFQADVP